MLRLLADHDFERRRFLTIGGLSGLGLAGRVLSRAGLGGLALGSAAAPARPSDALPKAITGKSVIFLFQQGGPSQFETFDPKMDAPAGVRSVNGSRSTRLPGVVFGDSMERLATLNDRFAIVRSFQTTNAGHNIQPIVGPHSRQTNIGVHYSRVAGAQRAATGIPTNSVIYPAAVADDVPGPEARGNLASTGDYGAGFAPFVPGAGGQLQQDMEIRLSPDRLGDRRRLLRELDRLERDVDASGAARRHG